MSPEQSGDLLADAPVDAQSFNQKLAHSVAKIPGVSESAQSSLVVQPARPHAREVSGSGGLFLDALLVPAYTPVRLN